MLLSSYWPHYKQKRIIGPPRHCLYFPKQICTMILIVIHFSSTTKPALHVTMQLLSSPTSLPTQMQSSSWWNSFIPTIPTHSMHKDFDKILHCSTIWRLITTHNEKYINFCIKHVYLPLNKVERDIKFERMNAESYHQEWRNERNYSDQLPNMITIIHKEKNYKKDHCGAISNF